MLSTSLLHSYETGVTPNPCIDCNRYLKFDKLFQRMVELNYDYVVTGITRKSILTKIRGGIS